MFGSVSASRPSGPSHGRTRRAEADRIGQVLDHVEGRHDRERRGGAKSSTAP